MTRVLFRADKSGPHKGDITAVFPDIPADYAGRQMTCYAHVGQHSGCTRAWVTEVTRPAKPEEYAALLKELRAVGYDNLKVIDRLPR